VLLLYFEIWSVIIFGVGCNVKRLLIVEDQSADLRMAVDVIKTLGFSSVEARTSSTAAKAYLEAVLQGKEPLPDVMIVDLDLGYESGFELLRFRHGHPELSPVHLIVWTVLGEQQQHICRLFKVDAVVSKGDGVLALKRALEPLAAAAS
jgi:CheY-like chemotaxis protein